MKYKIIFGFSVILVLTGNVRAKRCVQHPAAMEGGALDQCRNHWMKKIQKYPSNDTSVASRKGEMHCFTRCIYEKMGIFYDHQFHPHMIEEIIQNYVHHSWSKYLLEWCIWSAEEANKMRRDDCQMADIFWSYNNISPLKELNHKIYCKRDPWLNP